MRRFFLLVSFGIVVWWIVNCIVSIFFSSLPYEQLQKVVLTLIIIFALVATVIVIKLGL